MLANSTISFAGIFAELINIGVESLGNVVPEPDKDADAK
jgi:hypothetical protein